MKGFFFLITCCLRTKEYETKEYMFLTNFLAQQLGRTFFTIYIFGKYDLYTQNTIYTNTPPRCNIIIYTDGRCIAGDLRRFCLFKLDCRFVATLEGRLPLKISTVLSVIV